MIPKIAAADLIVSKLVRFGVLTAVEFDAELATIPA